MGGGNVRKFVKSVFTVTLERQRPRGMYSAIIPSCHLPTCRTVLFFLEWFYDQ